VNHAQDARATLNQLACGPVYSSPTDWTPPHEIFCSVCRRFSSRGTGVPPVDHARDGFAQKSPSDVGIDGFVKAPQARNPLLIDLTYALSALDSNWITLTQGVALGFYISRLRRTD